MKKFIAMLLIAGVVMTSAIGCGTATTGGAKKDKDAPVTTDKKDKDKP